MKTKPPVKTKSSTRRGVPVAVTQFPPLPFDPDAGRFERMPLLRELLKPDKKS
jgi:hypothetical protein